MASAGQADTPAENLSRMAACLGMAGHRQQPLAHLQGTLGVGMGHQHGEFVAADTEAAIGVSRDLADKVAQLAQHFIAGGVAFALIEHVEVVHVDDEQSDRHLVAPKPLDLSVKFFLEGAEVAQPGQAIAHRVGLGGLVEALKL